MGNPKMKRQKITKELLDQDENVFVSKNSRQKGLQQFFTPMLVGELIRQALEYESGIAFDPTAGCGNLLLPMVAEKGMALGVELDKSNIPDPPDERVRIVNANLVELYPFLKRVDFKCDCVSMNPPFNLFWKSPELTGSDDKAIESQLATVRIGMDLLKDYGGSGAFIVAESTLNQWKAEQPQIWSKVFASITLRNAFHPFSDVVVVLSLFAKATRFEVVERVSLDWDLGAPGAEGQIPRMVEKIQAVKRLNRLYAGIWSGADEVTEMEKRFSAAVNEYKARKAAKQVYTIDYVSGRLKVYLSNYARFILDRDCSYQERNLVDQMHGLAPSYFAFNVQNRRALFALVEKNSLITLSPVAKSAIEKAVEDGKFILTPMYALKPQQRLAYLEDCETIRCTKSFRWKGAAEKVTYAGKDRHRNHQYGRRTEDDDSGAFQSGESYPVNVSTATVQASYEKERGPEGKLTDMIKVGKALSIRIGNTEFGETSEEIDAIVQHFEVPDPQDVRHVKPNLYDRINARLRSAEFEKFTLRPFQVEDMTRCAMKNSAVLAHEQGLGKTREALAWAKLRYGKRVLIICPQDLKRQWIEEGNKLSIPITEIRDYRGLQEASSKKQGYYIIHYELLKGSRRYDMFISEMPKPEDDEENLNLNALCPKCRSLRQDGWTGKSCKKCGFHIWERRVKPMYTRMKRTFDTVIVDEGVKIKSKSSMQGVAVRSLHARNRLLLSGSPIKGWITDAFWLLHWTLGNGTARFPYQYKGGTEKFLDDFGVFEYVAEEFRSSLSKGKKKLLPEIGNLHLLWKLFAPTIIRRTKAETGENLVGKNVHRIKVSFTENQKQVYDWWIKNFSDWFKASHVTEMDDDQVAMREMILGLLWKLRLTATVPNSRLLPGKPDPGMETTFFAGAQGKSAYTEKTLFVVSKVKEVIERGEQIVVFSSLQDYMRVLHELLARFKVKAEVANAEASPQERGLMMSRFKQGEFPVLIAGTQAVSLGHSLDNACNVIMTDYEWDHSTTRQALDRVHRFTSKKDVNVYLLYTDGGIDQKQLFEIIDRKGQASDLALDGKLMDQEEMHVDFFKIARQIMSEHVAGTEGLLTEHDVERQIFELFRPSRVTNPVNVGVEEMVPVPDLVYVRAAKRSVVRSVVVNQIDMFG